MQVTVLLEAIAGRPERYELGGSPSRWRLATVLEVPWPTAYGFVPDTLNPADGEPCDVIVLSAGAGPVATAVEAELVGLLVRADGDHKLLAVLAGDHALGEPPDLARVPAAQRAAIQRFFGFRGPILRWAGAEEARACLDACRQAIGR